MKNIVFDLGRVVFAHRPEYRSEERKRFFSYVSESPMPQFWVDYDKGVSSLQKVAEDLAAYRNVEVGYARETNHCSGKYYCHFTSPIRRYPDLIVHRLARKYIIHSDNLLSDEEHYKLTSQNAEIAKLTSEYERRAIDCEYKVLDMKKAEYMQK